VHYVRRQPGWLPKGRVRTRRHRLLLRRLRRRCRQLLAGSQGARQCVVYDARQVRDLNGNLTGDKFVGPVCIYGYSSNADGAECINPSGSTNHNIDACVDGEECFLGRTFPGGDNQCHHLCAQNAVAVDAGSPACSAPQSCHDLWGLFGTPKPIGLCY